MTKRQTPCKNCAFAIYMHTNTPDELDKPCQQQTDCLIGMLEKWRNIGVDVVAAYDNEKEFFVINDVCIFGRSKGWLERHKDSESLYDDVRQELEIQSEVLIYVNEQTSKNDIIKTVQCLEGQILQPHIVVFVQHPNTKFKMPDYYDIMKNVNMQWSVEFILDTDCQEGGYESVNIDRCIDIGIKNSKRENCFIIEGGSTIPKNYIKWVDCILNDDLRQLLVVTPISNTYTGLFVRKSFHQLVGGNRTRPFLDKVQTLLIEGDEETCKKVEAGINCQ